MQLVTPEGSVKVTPLDMSVVSEKVTPLDSPAEMLLGIPVDMH
jgi:hypothetical protein